MDIGGLSKVDARVHSRARARAGDASRPIANCSSAMNAAVNLPAFQSRGSPRDGLGGAIEKGPILTAKGHSSLSLSLSSWRMRGVL